MSIMSTNMSPKSSSVNEKLLAKVARTLFASAEEQVEFCEKIQEAQLKESALLHLAGSASLVIPDNITQNDIMRAFRAFLPDWVSILGEAHDFGKSPEHERGEIYCLDLSSALAVSLLTQPPIADLLPKHPRVLDLCSSPGGKSIFVSKALEPKLLCCNEVSHKRHAALTVNLQRCKIPNALVTDHDPPYFAKELPQNFDLVLVDAPCSGQSLVMKGLRVDGAFHEQTQRTNAMRQRRILSHAAQALASDGVLLYSTCTFSRGENEYNLEWLLKKNKHLEAIEIPSYAQFQSKLVQTPCYRFYPHCGQGAGGFAAVLRASSDSTTPHHEAKGLAEVLSILRIQWKSRIGGSFDFSLEQE